MSTIEIIQEPSNVFRARCRNWQAFGTTPGAALDAVARLVAASDTEDNGTIVIMQRFRPDAYFSKRQQDRIRELMAAFHDSRARGQELAPQEKRELEVLVEAEWQGAIERAAEILEATKQSA